MASDHQTQAGKPQPLNPKVGATWVQGGAGGLAELLYQTQFPFCRVGLASAFPGLPLSASAPPCASVSPLPWGTGGRGALIVKAPPWPTTGKSESQHQLPALET